MDEDTMMKLKQKDLEQGRVSELKCRYTKVNAQGSKTERFECTKSMHDWKKRKPKGFVEAIIFDHDVSVFVRICKRGAMDGLK